MFAKVSVHRSSLKNDLCSNHVGETVNLDTSTNCSVTKNCSGRLTQLDCAPRKIHVKYKARALYRTRVLYNFFFECHCFLSIFFDSNCVTVLQIVQKMFLLTLPVLCISESYIEIKIKLNFYFHTSLWCLKRFYEGLLFFFHFDRDGNG